MNFGEYFNILFVIFFFIIQTGVLLLKSSKDASEDHFGPIGVPVLQTSGQALPHLFLC
jgi:hypothetical protein